MSRSSPLASFDDENTGDAASSLLSSCGGVEGRGVSLNRTPLAEPGSAVMATPHTTALYMNFFLWLLL
jgi:hypothetical protein